MDPQACLDRLASAVADLSYGEAVSALNDYYRWRVRGGFEPQWVGTRGVAGDIVADELANKLANAVDSVD